MAFDPDKYLSSKSDGFDPNSYLAKTSRSASSETMREVGQGVGNVAAGAVRGAGSIGATILAPLDIARDAIAGRGLSLESNRERRGQMDAGLQSMGAEPDSLGYQAGKFGGEVAGTLGVGGVLANGLTKAGATPAVIEALRTWGMTSEASTRAGRVALRAGAGGTVGLAAGGLIDPESAPLSAGIGAGAAVALPPVFGKAAELARRAKSVIRPSPGEIGVKAAGDKTDEVIAALMTERSGVPGVNLNAGQASAPANSAEFAALNKLVSKDRTPSLSFGKGGIKGQQEAARLAAVQRFGGTPDELSTAIADRSARSGQAYQASFDNVVSEDAALKSLMKNPYLKAELTEAKTLVQANNNLRELDGLPARDSLTELLDFVKKGLDAKLEAGPATGGTAIAGATKSAVTGAKQALVRWMGKANPDYDAARLAHIQMSKPINQMKVMQDIEGALAAPGTGKERATSFSNAVSKVTKTISKSTGKPQIEALTPQQRLLLGSINDDFARNANYGELAQAGSGKSLERRIGAPVVPPSGFFSPIVSFGRSMANKTLGVGYESGLERLGPEMANPKKMAELMRNATPKQRAIMDAMIERMISQGAIVGAAQEKNGSLSLADLIQQQQ